MGNPIFDLNELVFAIHLRLQNELENTESRDRKTIIDKIYRSYPFTSDLFELPKMKVSLLDKWLTVEFPSKDVELRTFNKEPHLYFTEMHGKLVFSDDEPHLPTVKQTFQRRSDFVGIYEGIMHPGNAWLRPSQGYPFQGVIRLMNRGVSYVLLPTTQIYIPEGTSYQTPSDVFEMGDGKKPDFTLIGRLEAQRLAELLHNTKTSQELLETFVRFFDKPRYPPYDGNCRARYGRYIVNYLFDQRDLIHVRGNPEQSFNRMVRCAMDPSKDIKLSKEEFAEPQFVFVDAHEVPEKHIEHINFIRKQLGLAPQAAIWNPDGTLDKLVDEDMA
ncbi:hypothetical protein [Vibrio phage phiKT1028]|nr:hypothetical protein [Vibrio phage phiKT1028]